ncbi:YeeE/YedE family protein [Alginatibacterium sediminis]|uniref:YeeE/YedE family protein n=1 Tax=Alginatibacterium sediminis TaxID=2164068 RepID=A0A420ED39_9ALTE|nr:YeeE/YedE family protein [Alginatibacterium sediminis]RKF18542.1 YeeE/YedE family protein [Alginatibacterium sediminis]
MKRSVIALISGLFFGLGMNISGMVYPEKVLGFLNLFSGAWDPSLIFVIGGALLVFAPFYHLVIKKRSQSLCGDAMCLPHSKQIDKPLVYGAVIFGLGWGLIGICPGPALAGLMSFESELFFFVAAMFAGNYLASLWQKRANVEVNRI